MGLTYGRKRCNKTHFYRWVLPRNIQITGYAPEWLLKQQKTVFQERLTSVTAYMCVVYDKKAIRLMTFLFSRTSCCSKIKYKTL